MRGLIKGIKIHKRKPLTAKQNFGKQFFYLLLIYCVLCACILRGMRGQRAQENGVNAFDTIVCIYIDGEKKGTFVVVVVATYGEVPIKMFGTNNGSIKCVI